jgi:hypothetical protein
MIMKIDLKIKYTKDYNKFKFIESINRSVDPKHVQKMVESVRTMGVIRPIICTITNIFDGTKGCYIVDGQHLFNALAAEGLEIPYVLITAGDECEIVHKMAMLNNSSKSWTLMNYVNAFKMQIPDYRTLIALNNKYNIEPLMLATICTNGNSSIVTGSNLIKSGQFRITNVEAQSMAKAFNDFFIKIGRADRWVKQNFLQVFIRAWGTYDHDKSLTNLDKHIKTIKAMSDTGAAEAFISKNIFNLTK